MSVLGIASTILTGLNALQGSKTTPTSAPNFQSELSQLGEDLQSGNLPQAQSDFSALSQNVLTGSSAAGASSATGANSLTQAVSQLGKDLQSGNLYAAQQDYKTIQFDLQQKLAQTGVHHHRHPPAQGAQDASSSQQSNPVAQAFSQFAADLQSGNLQGSQQAFATLQNDLQQLGGGIASRGSTGAANTLTRVSAGGLNVIV